MKKQLVILVTMLGISLAAYGQQLAFPGAEGYGKFATGGRGGIVVEVSNLSDSGAGSLREALTASKYKGKKRTIIFTVSGNIELQSMLKIKYDSFITVAGQTAPGDGICIKNFSLKIEDSHDIIIRYIRFRPGDQQPVDTDQDVLDALDALSFRKCYNLVVDHCSLSWSIDDVLDLTVSTGFCTVQWCILSEPLTNARHSKGAHGYIAGWDGSSFGGGMGFGGGSYHHNLLSSGGSRTPRLDRYADGTQRDLIDIVNNVIYNWGGYGAYGGESADVNWQNNYYKWGPNTDYSKRRIIFIPGDTCRMYVDGNYVDGFQNVTDDNVLGIKPATASIPASTIVQSIPYPVIGVTMQTAADAYNTILAHAGAYCTTRDSCDSRIIKEVIDRKGKHIDSQTQVGGWPVLVSTTKPVDSDSDGLPDHWETFKGLGITNAADRNTIASDGYTMLEKYLNAIELSRPIPDDITLVRTSETSVSLNWSDIYFQESGFIIERAINDGNFEVLVTVKKDISSYTDSTINLTDLFTYRIKVKTSDWDVDYSMSVSTDVLPTKITNLTPTFEARLAVDTVTFSWSKSDLATTYNLYVGLDSMKLTKIATLIDTKFTYQLPRTDTSFYWRVDATNTLGTTQGDISTFGFINTSITSQTQTENRATIFPNPSIDNLVIKWSNSISSHVIISIYDITGVLVNQLVNDIFNAGNYNVKWNGMLADGTNLKQGVYLCVIDINNKKQVLKLNRID